MSAPLELACLLPFEWARYAFMQNALVAVLLITPLLALLGCMVVNHQMSFFSESIGHSALMGVAAGVLLGARDPLGAMLAVAVLLALGLSLLRRYSAVPPDTAIALTMSFTVALGVAVLSRGGAFARYSHYLIGDILTITQTELLRLAALAAGVVLLWMFSFNPIFMVGVNRSWARSRGVRVAGVEVLFAVVVAVVVTMSLRWVGLLVINAMLVLPAAAARNVARDTPRYVAWSVGLGLAAGVSGLVTSFYAGTATGATIVLFAAAFLALSLLLRALGVRL